LEGECAKNFQPEDIYKAILLNQLEIHSKEIPDPESGKKEPLRRKKANVAQDPA
jgi:hypothetical protein